MPAFPLVPVAECPKSAEACGTLGGETISPVKVSLWDLTALFGQWRQRLPCVSGEALGRASEEVASTFILFYVILFNCSILLHPKSIWTRIPMTLVVAATDIFLILSNLTPINHPNITRWTRVQIFQKSARKKHGSILRTHNIRPHRTKSSSPGDLAPGVCAPLRHIVCNTYGIFHKSQTIKEIKRKCDLYRVQLSVSTHLRSSLCRRRRISGKDNVFNSLMMLLTYLLHGAESFLRS